MIKAIIFDFDGMIHDTFDLAYKINVEISEKKLSKDNYRDFFNGNIFERTEIDEENARKFYKLQNEAFKYLRLDDKIKINLEKLSEKYPLFIISSNQEEALNIYFQNNNSTHIFKKYWGWRHIGLKLKSLSIYLINIR